MDLESHFGYCKLTATDSKRVEVGDEVYLVSPGGISKRQDVLFREDFDKMPHGTAPYTSLDFKSLTVFREKVLDVKAKICLTYGPLGLRTNFFAEYDGKTIGNFSSLSSYAGGGSSGEWPKLSGPGWRVIFEMPLGTDQQVNQRMLVEHYTTVTEDPEIVDRRKLKTMLYKEFPAGFFQTPCTPGQMENKREVKWTIPVCEDSYELRGTLSLCRYPGFIKYSLSPWLWWEDEKLEGKTAFIGKSIDRKSGLYTVEYESACGRQIIMPWTDVLVDLEKTKTTFGTNRKNTGNTKSGR